MPTIDLDGPSRIEGWRNRDVLAQLSLQPALLIRFIAKSSSQAPQVRLCEIRDACSGARGVGKMGPSALPRVARAEDAPKVRFGPEGEWRGRS